VDEDLAGGKWRKMMSQTHIGYTYWQQPPTNVIPATTVVKAASGWGVAVEGRAAAVDGAADLPPLAPRRRGPPLDRRVQPPGAGLWPSPRSPPSPG
jgi:hypothetical protein